MVVIHLGIYDSNCDYNKYKIFYVVAELNSFSRAAEFLHISQPAISYSIKELENQLNTTLFIRENRKIKLTDDGEKLIYYLHKAFNEINVAEKLILEGKGVISGTVKLGIYSHLALLLLPNILKEFNEKYPEVKFEIFTSSSEELKEKLKIRDLDFIVTQYPLLFEESEVFTEEKIFELENTFFTTKHYYDLYKNNKLEELPLLLPFRGYVDIDMLDELIKDQNFKIKNTYRVYTLDLTKKLVLNEFGIGWGPRKCVEEELKKKELYEIFLDFKTPNTKFSITYNDKFLTDTSKNFISFLKEKTKNIK